MEDTFSNFIYNLMDTFAWTARNLGVALLYQAPSDPRLVAPPSVDNLVGCHGYQELDVPGYSRVDGTRTTWWPGLW